MVTVRLVIAGLVAMGVGNDGELTVAVPRVERLDSGEKGYLIPGHEATLGIWLPEGGSCPMNEFEEAKPPLPWTGTLCWLKLLRSTVEVVEATYGSVESDPDPASMFLVGRAARPRESRPHELRDIFWLADSSRFAPQVKMDPQCRTSDCWLSPACPVQALGRFDFNRRHACRLAGAYDRWLRKYGIQDYEFHSPGERRRTRQSLAEATTFEIDLRTAEVHLKVTSYPPSTCSDLPPESLRITVPTSKEGERQVAHVALMNFVPDDQSVAWWLTKLTGVVDPRVDDHFRVLYGLIAPSQPFTQQFVPMAMSRRSSWFDAATIGEICPTPFLMRPDSRPFEVIDERSLDAATRVLDLVQPKRRKDPGALQELLWALFPGPTNVPVPHPRAQVAGLLGPPLCPGLTLPVE